MSVIFKKKPKPDNHLFVHATDNSDIQGKKMVRDWCMEKVGGAANCSVLELYGGMGHVHDHCYVNPPVKQHMAFELRKVDRPTWVCGDNNILIRKHVQGWDLYDIDAYSNPWIMGKLICKLRDPGRFTMAMTCGVIRGLNTGTTNGYVRQTCGYNGMPNSGLLTRFYEDIVQLMVADYYQHGVKLISGKKIKSRGSHVVTYYGLYLEKE